ncbi:hypothetical protein R6V09_47590, partial [Streptomyces sp. W16]|uniref:hypothetical protein n=1 Tax=Streptomyces sp. W16 TaxID=3076631 RepID=UPI00295BD84E
MTGSFDGGWLFLRGAAVLRLVPDASQVTASRADLTHVSLEVTDSQGRLAPDSAALVTFRVDGAGELAAMGNGTPHNVGSFRLPRRRTWHGRGTGDPAAGE